MKLTKINSWIIILFIFFLMISSFIFYYFFIKEIPQQYYSEVKVDANNKYKIAIDSELAYKLKVNSKIHIFFNNQEHEFLVEKINFLENNNFEAHLKKSALIDNLIPNTTLKIRVNFGYQPLYKLFWN
ncbi:MAG1140 family protein [Mycoplasmopsis pulmonis]|nr:hypothetical protein [Mycoplasmopsis pulmonis]MDZ7293331.1 hypothetical protein [Mycoplasmopsis pulmonis]VEU68139.1 Uncharacterised protein [Mycoplasmopsis pulmonis]